MSVLAPTLQAFFTDRLIRQRQASAHTIAAYRDTLRLLLAFASGRTGTAPSRLDLSQLDAALIVSFLDYVEHDRHNSVRTRNARLAAIHSLFRYAALRHPENASSIQRVLEIPPKRFDRALVTYLGDNEIDALLAAPDHHTWTGWRDRALLMLAVQTGLRISELIGLTCSDIHPWHRRVCRLSRKRSQRQDHAAHNGDCRYIAHLDRRKRLWASHAPIPKPERTKA
jgi:integrase/recombinase XerD